MTKFILVRHALTDMVGQTICGRMEGVPLNEEGVGQAGELAQRLSRFRISAIYGSPLQRVVETLAPFSELVGLPYENEAAFTEIDFGDWTQATIHSLKSQPAFNRFNSFRSFARIPGGELMLEAQLRMINRMEQLYHKHPGQTVVIASHGDLIKVVIAYFAGIPIDLFYRIEIDPGSISIIDVYEETAQIRVINHTGDLMK